MGKKQTVSVKSERVERKKVVEYLEALTSSLKAGSLFIKHGTQEMALYPKNSVSIEVKASKKNNNEKFEIGISWNVVPEQKAGTELTISNKIPINFGKVEKKVAVKPAAKTVAKPAAKTAVKKGTAAKKTVTKAAVPVAKKR